MGAGRTRRGTKNRRTARRFAGIPHSVLLSDDYIALNHSASRLLLELAMQYNGFNNGNLSATHNMMKKRGIKSPNTVNSGLQQLLRNKLIIKTRDGWFTNPGGQCCLYALTWESIDECPGKGLDVSPTQLPTRRF